MQSPNQFIVVPANDRRYNNIKNIEGIEIILDTSEESASFSNREAVVLSTPINYTGPIEEGDTLLVHHNVFKYYNDMHGRRQSGKSFFKDNKFFIDDTQYYMYKKISEWYAVEPFCFVSPLPATETYIYKPFTHEPLMGTMEYTCPSIERHGIKKGDIVTFMPDSEYEFSFDQKKLYRIRSKNIIAYESTRN
mgnify:CR=1 FL=1|jgi:bifunctional DNA-binding transcriptional regulator/antitoxin component of YhaV-PrlF toxin-antitoxin module|tara:strand:+ start:4629 stop:5204 length:576 start_codon:yes stop_codon:yes gene_type:complete